jgi:hypothetical protein
MMSRRTVWAGWAVLAAWLPGIPAPAQAPRESPAIAPAAIPLDDLTPEARARVRAVLEHPTLRSHGRVETFTCQPSVYDWLLDHPDLAVRLWRLIGAKCSDILPEDGERFVWKDGASHIHWNTVLKQPGLRVWYAEGELHPGMFLPGAAVKAAPSSITATESSVTAGRHFGTRSS